VYGSMISSLGKLSPPRWWSTVVDGTPDAITARLRRPTDSRPAIRPIIRLGRDAAVIDPKLTDLVERVNGPVSGRVQWALSEVRGDLEQQPPQPLDEVLISQPGVPDHVDPEPRERERELR
jgi:hypothetical protein